MRSAFESRYHGNHVFLDATRLKLDGYEDVLKYRYVLDFHHYSSSMVDTDGRLRTSGISEYYIHDRVDNKDYSSKYKSSMFGKYLKAYAEELEKKRLAEK
ncbi:hypothetical protein SAMN05444144_109135 [Flavobacterium akiainvivens]|nr:hypothetical protein SAMN05444144_109135 [Flavobacterium akiainvivens]